MASKNSKQNRLNRWVKTHWVLSMLLVILLALGVATAVKYNQTHSYITNPDPSLTNK